MRSTLPGCPWRGFARPELAVGIGALLAGAAPLAAQVPAWRVDSAAVAFEVRNAGLPVRGSFDRVEVRVCFDPIRPEASSLSGTIDPGSIRTGIGMRDRHLQRRGWFDVPKFGAIEMRSVRLRRTSAGYAGIFTLRIRDVRREVELPFTFEREGEVARLTGELTVDRLDYGLGKPSIVLSDDVTIRVELGLALTPSLAPCLHGPEGPPGVPGSGRWTDVAPPPRATGPCVAEDIELVVGQGPASPSD